MCGKGGGDGGAAQARADEAARQMQIRQGTAKINSIFNGSFTPGGQQLDLANAAGGRTYYTADGKKLDVAANENALDAYARRALADFGGDVNNAQQIAITKGNLAGHKVFTEGKETGGFGDEFFAKQRQGFLDYATPQLEDQYGDAQKQLTFALDRSGNLDSSARGSKTAALQKSYDLNKQQVADQALSYESQARNSVEDARAGLIASLNAAGDATGAANSALARSAALSTPPSYSALGSLFTDFTSGLGAQAAAEKAEAASNGGYKARYNTGLFGGTNKSVKVTR